MQKQQQQQNRFISLCEYSFSIYIWLNCFADRYIKQKNDVDNNNDNKCLFYWLVFFPSLLLLVIPPESQKNKDDDHDDDEKDWGLLDFG